MCLVCCQDYEEPEDILSGYCPDCDPHDEWNEQYRQDIKDGLI